MKSFIMAFVFVLSVFNPVFGCGCNFQVYKTKNLVDKSYVVCGIKNAIILNSENYFEIVDENYNKWIIYLDQYGTNRRKCRIYSFSDTIFNSPGATYKKTYDSTEHCIQEHCNAINKLLFDAVE